MRSYPLFLVLALTLCACGDKDPEPAPAKGGAAPAAKPAGVDQSSPTALAESIFAAARSGSLAALTVIVAPADADGDSKEVANVGSAPADKQADFKKHFEKGKATGEKVEGDKAAVTILFGPDGTKQGTLNMVRVAGKWYLKSF